MSGDGEIWTISAGTVTMLQDGRSQDTGLRAFACPTGMYPSDLDWSRGGQQTMSRSLTWSNPAREFFGLSSGTQLRIGCTWSYGGRSASHPGLYLGDAYLWSVLDYSSAGTRFEVAGGFSDASRHGNSAELRGWITARLTYTSRDWGQWRCEVRIRGDGSGYLSRL